MGRLSLLAMAAVILGAAAYLPGKETPLLADALWREVVERMGKDLAAAAAAAADADADAAAADDAYLDLAAARLAPLLPGRAKGLDGDEPPPLDYERLAQLANPSLRDREYLQHSSLWGRPFLGGGGGAGGAGAGGDGKQGEGGKGGEAALPAYCNPPNPCPVGYGAADGCLERFENTAVFSRDFQAAQDCMCDSEHMFDCPAGSGRDVAAAAADFDADLDRLVEQFQVEDQHKSLVAKKFHVKKDSNPFLRGEKLPVAAKKGNNVY